MSLESMATRLQETAFSELLQKVVWVVPTLQAIHILMIGVVFVSILMVALRVLGMVRGDASLQQVWARFAPFLWVGLLLMALTGLLLIIAEPVREVMAFSFRLKMILLVVGIAGAAAFGRSVQQAASPAADLARPASPLLRAASVGTVLLWLFIIFLGRAIAYDDSVWGSQPPVAQQEAAP